MGNEQGIPLKDGGGGFNDKETVYKEKVCYRGCALRLCVLAHPPGTNAVVESQTACQALAAASRWRVLPWRTIICNPARAQHPPRAQSCGIGKARKE